MRSRQGSDCHVATSPRRDVTKSRRRVNNAEVNNSATSRRDHVATSPRRDVSSKFCISSFNVRMAEKLGYREAYEQRHSFQSRVTRSSRKCPGFVSLFMFLIFSDIRTMFSLLNDLILSFIMF